MIRGGRRKSEDRRSSEIFARSTHAVELGAKTFVSQPLLTVRTDRPRVDGEDRSDVSPTTSSCMSRTKASDTHSGAIASPNPSQNSSPRSEDVDGLPEPVSPHDFRTPNAAHSICIDGLPAPEDARWLNAVKSTSPNAKQISSGVVSLESHEDEEVSSSHGDGGMTDSDSQSSAQVSCSCI